jgi:hypothetical protein
MMPQVFAVKMRSAEAVGGDRSRQARKLSSWLLDDPLAGLDEVMTGQNIRSPPFSVPPLEQSDL